MIRGQIWSLLVLVVTLLGCLAPCAFANPDQPTAHSPLPVQEASSEPVTEAAYARWQEVEQVRLWLGNLVGDAAKGDVRAELLAEKFRSQTCAMLLEHGTPVSVPPRDLREGKCEGTPFVVLGLHEPIAVPVGMKVAGGPRYENGVFVYVPQGSWTPWYLGALTLRLVVQWDDQHTGFVSSDARRFSPEWLDAELRAYDAEFAAIDRHTDGRFSRTLHDAVMAQGLVPPVPPSQFPHLQASDIADLAYRGFGDTAGSEENGYRWGSTAVAYYLTLAGNDPEVRRHALVWVIRQKS